MKIKTLAFLTYSLAVSQFAYATEFECTNLKNRKEVCTAILDQTLNHESLNLECNFDYYGAKNKIPCRTWDGFENSKNTLYSCVLTAPYSAIIFSSSFPYNAHLHTEIYAGFLTLQSCGVSLKETQLSCYTKKSNY